VELQTQEQTRFQRREWAAQKAGTIVLVAFILAALVGLLGAGPLASTTRSSPQGLISVELDRVTRFEADDSMTMTFAPQAVENGTITLELTGPWTSGIDLQTITPEPSEQQAISGGIVMTFPADPTAETDVSFSFAAQEHLTLEGRATVREDTVTFTQFVLP
jgi:hypothetical protein